MELVLPRLLAPDLPSIGSSLRIYIVLIPITRPGYGPVLLFLVTTSLCQDWVICVACCLPWMW
eukprot:TRINITY_DN1649_c0_g1_i1.p2 TRINITY_DN1649_c0_g1~~TRINITY_DN1649_c0_g1_i1.p2  ORF type:complete len:63 (+),score=2.74 TRINITY_DN1649_c0_g1_i1:766-954(+)